MILLHDDGEGRVYGAFTGNALSAILLAGADDAPPNPTVVAPSLARELTVSLGRYFTGESVSFEGVPLALPASPLFRNSVWEATRRIPWGETRTYGELAREIGNHHAARAVGQALGANPVPIIIPCHRVLVGDGSLGGFGCGLPWKRRLLALEGVHWRE